MAASRSPTEECDITSLQRALAEGFDAKAWHGPTLRGCLRGVSVELASWKPAPDRHSIWELALHCAYWKHRVRCRIGGVESRFGRSPSNFPSLPVKPDAQAWKRDLALLNRAHRALVEAVQSLDPSTLDEPAPRRTRREQILGAAFHDVYHAGQIRLLKKLAPGR